MTGLKQCKDNYDVYCSFEKAPALADSMQEMVGLKGFAEVSDVRSFWTKEKRETQVEVSALLEEDYDDE